MLLVVFQSSTGLSARCNLHIQLSKSTKTKRFNPQRAFRPVATKIAHQPGYKLEEFQSSTGLSARCNHELLDMTCTCEVGFNPQRAFRPVATGPPAGFHQAPALVSILNGPFGPLQRGL